MQNDALQNLKEICEREPVHIPGSIQPHGVLLVIDPKTELVLQVAGDASALLGAKHAIQGRAISEVLGTPLAALSEKYNVVLGREPK